MWNIVKWCDSGSSNYRDRFVMHQAASLLYGVLNVSGMGTVAPLVPKFWDVA